MSAHHQSLAPSSLPALEECACYVSDSRETPWSEAGTTQHAVLAHILEGLKDTGLNELEIEGREGVKWAADYVKGYTKKDLFIERRMALLDDDFKEITFGTPDAYCLYDNGEGVDVFDFKSGQIANYEAQVAAYALMVMRATGTHTATTHVLFGRFQKAFRFTMTRREAQTRVDSAIARAKNPNRIEEPCKFCDWCAKAATCSALANRANAVVAGREDWALEQYHATKIDDPAEMAKALKIAKAVVAWSKAIIFHAEQMASKGQMPTGFTWKEKQGNRGITNILDAYEALGLPREKFMPLCSVPIGEIEKTYAEFFGKTLAVSKREVAQKLEPCLERGKPSKSLTQEKE